MSGWISIHRRIQDHWLWKEKPFDKKSAWIDLILMANHKDNKFLLGNDLVEVERGSFITSEYKLMERWGWSKTKVRAFLELLQNENMLIKNSDKKKTTLTIVNYSDYQLSETTERLQKDYKETTERLHKNPNNNDNNENNDNKENIYNPVIDYLNLKTGKSYKATSKKTKDLIRARQNDGFTLDDFKKVIDNKVSSWTGTDWEKYLRPETLFGTKFESYLNEGGRTNGNTRANDSKDSWNLDHLITRV